MNREIAVHILGGYGISVEEAADGKAGAERFAASKPGEFDAVLMMRGRPATVPRSRSLKRYLPQARVSTTVSRGVSLTKSV